ncbi:MAG: hypothetical protein A3E01_06560 [Gammaproteobacteria bacterium RIFCSPHIGHO2_12_FULL_63_22]|nr:MAG: hypothetical protein A3E01_06560 [Gammaproteobacteria bacterium RIFCSPHIGHO2_12_FULL_63_22]
MNGGSAAIWCAMAAAGFLIGLVAGSVKTGSDFMDKAIEHGCAQMIPDTSFKKFEWRATP